MSETEIDKAHAVMSAAPENDAARLRFYERLADTELYVLLAGDPDGDDVEPELFEISDQQFVLVFDREERLATFVGRAAPYAGLPGRGLIQMLDGQDVGLALNLDVAPSAMLIPSDAVTWLAEFMVSRMDLTHILYQSFEQIGEGLGTCVRLVNVIMAQFIIRIPT